MNDGSTEAMIADKVREILDVVTHTALTDPQRDHALTVANLLLTTVTLPISLGTPEAIKAANEANVQWIQFLAGGYQVGAVCRVAPNAFEGEEGAKWNGKEGVAKAMRRGSVLVQFPDGAEESFFAADLEGRFG